MSGQELSLRLHQKAVFQLFIPANIGTVRGVIGAADYFDGRGVYGPGLGYRRAAESMGFALMKYDLGKPAEMDARERYDDVIAALSHFAAEMGRPELARAKLVFTGLSLGGRQALRFASYDPTRCLAVVAIHGAFSEKHGGPLDPGPICRVPAIFSVAGHDDIVGDSGLRQALAGRAAGAPWAGYIDPESKHPSVRCQELNIAFVQAVAAARLRAASSRGGSIENVDVDPGRGWLGRLEYAGDGTVWAARRADAYPYPQYPHDRRTAHWLPNEPVARLWAGRVPQAASGDAGRASQTRPGHS